MAWLTVAVALFGLACGVQDDGLPPGRDAGPRPDTGPPGPVCLEVVSATCTPPTSSPDPTGMMEACCYRRSNADRLDAPELRLSGIQVMSPPSLSNPVVGALLSNAFDSEVFNWLVSGTVTGTDVSIRTGYGVRNADTSFAFTMGAAPGPGDPNRWNPVTIAGTLVSEVLSTPAYDQTLTIPVFDSMDPTVLVLELPFKRLTIEMACLGLDRSCVGGRARGMYQTGNARLSGFLTVAESDASDLVLPAVMIDTTLCMFIAGMSGVMGSTCADVPQADWPVKPDSLCDATTCTLNPTGTTDVCDPASTCNAWQIVAGFAAHGVEIQ